MTESSNLEIPEAARQLAEQSVRQARASYDNFVAVVRKAQELASGATADTAARAREAQSKAQHYAEKNMQDAFDFAAQLARARDAQEYMAIYQRHAQSQVAAYASQAQELARLLAEAGKK